MRGASLNSRLHVERIQNDHADRFLQEVRDLPPILDVVVRRSMRLERLLVPVPLEQVERATRVDLLVEVVPLTPRFRSRPLDHPREQRAEVRCSPFARTERSEDGHRTVGHAHLTMGWSDPGPGATEARPERAVYRPSVHVERRW
jgi:hypothetical protein